MSELYKNSTNIPIFIDVDLSECYNSVKTYFYLTAIVKEARQQRKRVQFMQGGN